MKVVIAPQAFKGGLRGIEAARAMEVGVRRVYPDAHTVLVPVADGGDGTLEALVGDPDDDGLNGQASGGRYFRTWVTGPLGDPVEAVWGVMPDGHTVVVELARASGLVLVPEARREPRNATTYGTGELIRAALDSGYRHIIVGLGGSATNDGGVGIAQALGVRFMDKEGDDLPVGGASLARLDAIDLKEIDTRLKECWIRAATDVSNPLCGMEGASAVYGPQKGATLAVVNQLDCALRRYAGVILRDLGLDVLELPRAGAAGGAGAGLVAFLAARLESGGEVVCDALGLNDYLEEAALVVTGEGRMDGQTVYDKAPIIVAHWAKQRGIPVVAVAGTLGAGHEAVLEHGVVVVEAGAPHTMPLDEAMSQAYGLIADATERAVTRWKG
jgi:glycerate kinase